MKLIIKTIVLLFFSVNIANAQHDHSSHDHSTSSEHTHTADPPHGGEIKDVGKYHLEILFDVTTSSENMSIYILKTNMKQVDIKEATGKMTVKYKSGIEETYELTNNGIDKLFCNVKDVINPFNAIIIIIYKGKEYHCAYINKGFK